MSWKAWIVEEEIKKWVKNEMLVYKNERTNVWSKERNRNNEDRWMKQRNVNNVGMVRDTLLKPT